MSHIHFSPNFLLSIWSRLILVILFEFPIHWWQLYIFIDVLECFVHYEGRSIQFGLPTPLCEILLVLHHHWKLSVFGHNIVRGVRRSTVIIRFPQSPIAIAPILEMFKVATLELGMIDSISGERIAVFSQMTFWCISPLWYACVVILISLSLMH